MKKIITILLIGLFASIGVFATEHRLYAGKCYQYNEVMKGLIDADYAIKYEDDDDSFYFQSADWMQTAWILLSKEDLAKLRANIEKYFEWEKLAVEKEAELNKQLPNSAIVTKVIWNSSDEWYTSNGFSLSFTFLSQSKTNHQFVISSNKVTSTTNEFMDYKLEDCYFSKDQVQALYDTINEEAIEKQIAEIKKNKEVDSLFN